MNLIVLSEMSIYEELQRHCKIEKISIQREIAVHILPLEYDVRKVKNFLNEKASIIFQSKNAVAHSIKVHRQIKNITSGIVYCMGKYSAQKVKEVLLVEPKYPKNNYSSEKVLGMMLKDLKRESRVLIIKGKDGRNYIGDEISKRGFKTEVINVYCRKAVSLESLENKLIKSANNFFIVSSKAALINLVEHLEKIEGDYKSIVIVPNRRLLENISMDKISNSIIMNNNANPLEYIKAMREHNER